MDWKEEWGVWAEFIEDPGVTELQKKFEEMAVRVAGKGKGKKGGTH